MEIYEGKAFQTEETLNTKGLRRECLWHIKGIARRLSVIESNFGAGSGQNQKGSYSLDGFLGQSHCQVRNDTQNYEAKYHPENKGSSIPQG